MGTRGPQPTPTNVLKLRGSWLVNGRNGEPTPQLGVPDCPDWVSEKARPYWQQIAEQLSGMGVLALSDQLPMGLLCDALAMYVAAKQEVADDGLSQMGSRGGKVLNPAVRAMNTAWEQVLKASRELGLSPAARTRLRSVAEEGGTDNGAAKFFRA